MPAERERIGIYGGSFNPPHMAHVLVVAWALASGEIDRVWVIPTGGHPFGKQLAAFEDRMEMCRRALAPFGERVAYLDVEREPRVHFSIETMRELAARHPELSWRWIMGSDTLGDAPRWRDYDLLMKLAPPLVVPRRGAGAQPEAAAKLDFALPNLSSTFIREMVAAGRGLELAGLLPRGVLELVLERGLYHEPVH